ncbi:MAG: DUF1450 domain-containing protein [Solibacillus sp.]
MFKKLFQKRPVQLKNQIELCVSNRLYEHEEIDHLLTRQDVDIVEVGCNSRCEVCDAQFYAIVNGEVVSAASAKELMGRIEEALVMNSVM